jgi:hypothetical protein
MRDAEIEGLAHDRLFGPMRRVVAEIVPEPSDIAGNFRPDRPQRL